MINKNIKIIILGIIIGSPILLIFDINPSKLNSERIHISEVNPWMYDGTAICTANYGQMQTQICSDGAGGAIIVWRDGRISFDNPQIYVQRVDSNGNVRWAPNGTIICTTAYTYAEPQICSDGIGGAIITWQDRRAGEENYDIYSQRVDSNGNIMWTPNGLPICSDINMQISPRIHSDGIGGAIIVWRDNRSSSPYSYHLFAQKVDLLGNIQWANDGVSVSTTRTIYAYPSICSDGAGGAIFAWSYQWGGWDDTDIYTQWINSTGSKEWTDNGIAICTANHQQTWPRICSDGTGGAIISWTDYRNGLDFDIYAQGIDNNGIIKWTPNGTAICTMNNHQQYPRVCSDGAGGAFITWRDDRNVPNEDDTYIQKINSLGEIQWTINGNPVCITIDLQGGGWIINDGGGGVIVTWHDYRSGTGDTHIYAQRFNSNGIAQWTSNGVAVFKGDKSTGGHSICSDGRGGAIITYERDEWNGSPWDDIYAQHINSTGNIGVGVENGDENGNGDGNGNGNANIIEGYNVFLLFSLFLGIIFISIEKRKSLKK